MATQIIQDEEYSSSIQWQMWRRLLEFVIPYKHLCWALSVIAILTGICEVALPLFTKWTIDQLKEHGFNAELLPIALSYALMAIIFAFCIWGFIYVAGRISTGVGHDIRTSGFRKLQELSFSFYDRRAVGWLMARMTSDCRSLADIFGWFLLEIIWGICMFIGAAIVMFYLNWRLALIVLSVAVPLIIVSRVFQIRLLSTSRAMRKANSHITASFNEGIMGVRTSKSLVREQQNLNEFQTQSTDLFYHSMRHTIYHAIYMPIVITICSAGIGMALYFGGINVLNEIITLGTLVLFINYAHMISEPVMAIARMIARVQQAQASAERVASLLDTQPDVKDSQQVLNAIEQYAQQPQQQPDLAIDGQPDHINTIEFKSVTFEYKQGTPVLIDFNLKIDTGQTIALVGPTGGGKSTIISLVCRFYEPTSGQILINDLDYRQRSLHWLQSNLGIVLQTTHLFRGSVRENIRYGRLDAANEEIKTAAQLANAHQFITQLEKGYDTDVGEGGNNLSTGQKQLVSLARAILADPQILVMDEATSSVDTETEKLIQSGIEQVLQDRIAFVVAHRLSTIRSADRIIFIDDGQIVEDGTHDDLINLHGKYYQLYTNQFIHEKEDELLAN